MADDETGDKLNDDQLAFLRHARFGELPLRTPPAQFVELTETDPRRDLPEPVGDAREWRLIQGGAAG
jgi:hypothetical protein